MSIAVVFPGQGSQSVGMGKCFYDSCSKSKDMFLAADEALGYKLSNIIFEGSEDELRLTQNTQPALLTVSSVIWSAICDKVKPSFFAGHSLGEYTAVHAGGSLAFIDAVKAVHNRGKFMQTAVPVGIGAMAAVLGVSDEVVVETCKEVSKPNSLVEPANFNCDGQVVVAGNASAFDEFSEKIKAKGAKRVVMLPVSAPFHCSLMLPAKAAMADYLLNVSFSDLQIPIVNNIDAKQVVKAADVKDGLIRQVAGAVRWTESVKYMIANGVTTFIEVGNGAVLTGLIKKIDKTVECVNIATVEDIQKLV